MDGGPVSAHQGDLARPHRRHGRHGPHRPGDRAPARRLRRAGGLSQPQSANGRELQALSEAGRHGARRRYADPDHAGRAVDQALDQCRGAGRARAEGHRHQHVARLGGRRRRPDQGAQGAEDFRRRPRRVRQRTGGAEGVSRTGQCRAVPASRLRLGRYPPRDGAAGGGQPAGLGRRQGRRSRRCPRRHGLRRSRRDNLPG